MTRYFVVIEKHYLWRLETFTTTYTILYNIYSMLLRILLFTKHNDIFQTFRLILSCLYHEPIFIGL